MFSRLSIAFATAVVAATPALAQDIGFSSGVALVSEYEFNGLRQSDGPALQSYIEADIAGFYIGFWVSNVDETIIGPGDVAEYNLYTGYANTVGRFSYDIGYAAYYYNTSNFCCSDVILSGEFAATDAATIGLRVSSDPDTFDTINRRIYGSYAITDAITLDGRFGRLGSPSAGGHEYWSIGASYAATDSITLSAAYHDTTIQSDLLVLGVSFDVSTR